MTAQGRTPDGFEPIFRHFAAASTNALAATLSKRPYGLDAAETRLLGRIAGEALRSNVRIRLSRVLLLELHAAKLSGELCAGNDAEQFAHFVRHALTPEFGEHLDRRYPPLRPRLQRMVNRQRAAIEILLARFAADREDLARLLGGPPGRLTGLALGRGDLHAGGQSVARLSFENGDVMYKPRALRVDHVLDAFLSRVFADDSSRPRVPEVIDRGDYGWASFVAHRYCDGADELRAFYRGLGQWLAVLRLLGGVDIHFENLIAVGPQPIVVDVETLFAATRPGIVSGYGEAHDIAVRLIQGSVLRTGILPFRASTLGFDNVDLSAAGALQGEQPRVKAPTITGAGTTDARLEIIDVDIDMALNHPSPNPELHRYWDEVCIAFRAASETLSRLDADDELEALLAAFEGCPIREIRRPTMVYGEIGRMLWHPASLHDEAAAIERARSLFEANEASIRNKPSSPEEIAGEIDDLRHGDVPIFTVELAPERIGETLAEWRSMRAELEEVLIRSALVVTKLNDEMAALPEDDGRRRPAGRPHAANLDARRRALAGRAAQRLLQLAVTGDDGSVTWIAPDFDGDRWHIEPMQSDLYSGFGGIAVALAGYHREVGLGRADHVQGLEQILEGALRVLKAMSDGERPKTVGGFNGDGGRIWTWLTLHDLLGREAFLSNAIASAERLERDGFEQDGYLDVMDGCCGTIVPLLGLAEATGDPRWPALAARAGRHAETFIDIDGPGVRWSTVAFPEASGGFLHGAAGIAWSLARLVLAGAGGEADRRRWREVADAVFAFQESLFDESLGYWDNRRSPPGNSVHTWCNGSIGLGLAAGDLYARGGEARHLRDLRRAVAAAFHGWGITHTLCHGDFSVWELMVRASVLDPEAAAIDRDAVTARVVSDLEEHYFRADNVKREAYTPGLMNGLAGVIHGLSRLHPDCTLASPLLLEREIRIAG
jgi:type 2 lantibiotic biosynthesis protein LanM